uniref:Uncharacterized protein n=1 Tax=virus sp. ctmTa7 TaxID=2828255 RepID=A0A8S5RCS0_9VIRU|nr:MAG TPA: hypothetical protein [virus sp. ctmTa7]
MLNDNLQLMKNFKTNSTKTSNNSITSKSKIPLRNN